MFRFKLAEFFSGPGGMGYGAGLSKIKGNSIEHAWASDYDKDSCDTLIGKFDTHEDFTTVHIEDNDQAISFKQITFCCCDF